jgi:hypothetical protein
MEKKNIFSPLEWFAIVAIFTMPIIVVIVTVWL